MSDDQTPDGPAQETENASKPLSRPLTAETTEDMREDENGPQRGNGEADSEPDPVDNADDAPETFTRDYVAQLRDEAKQHRLRARDVETERDTLREQLWTARVAALGVLADPSDLPLDVDALDDPDAIAAAARALIARKPHMRRRTVAGDIGQHDQATTGEGFSMFAAFRELGRI